MSDSILREAPAPYGWRTVRLGELCRLVNGDAYKDSDWSREGVPIIRIQNLNNHSKPFNYWAGSLDDRVVVRDGDVLLAWSGTPGTSFGTHQWNRGLAVLNQHIFRVDLDQSRLDADWAVFAINQQLGTLIEQAHGAVGLRHVTRRECDDLEIPLPPLGEQRRIATRLKEQMAEAARSRSAAEAQLVSIGALLESCLRAAFRGIVPLSVGRDNATPPPGWQWLRLLDLARLESGHTPSRKRADWWGGDVSWIALPDIRRLDCREVHETSERTNALGLANSSARLLPRGTVCLSRTASVGYVTIMGREMTTSQDFVNWVCGAELDPWFLLWALRAARDFIRAQSTGAIHQTVYMPVAKSFEICAPPIAEQRRIAERLREQFAEIERARTAAKVQLEALKALPSALLREAFSEQI